VSDIVSAIAAAIEEQSTVTRDISRSVGEASTSVRNANQQVSEGVGTERDGTSPAENLFELRAF
jgi:methyl-accepting chemotaxis protein